METFVKSIQDIVQDGSRIPQPWQGVAVVNEDNVTYLVWNTESRESLLVDPMREDRETLERLVSQELNGYRMVAVIDTHTHADHVSSAAEMAAFANAPLIQHDLSPSKRIHFKVQRDTHLPTAAGPLTLIWTPGHTPDSIAPIWGPFVLTGDTVFFGDAGRDDLPGGNPDEHWDSLQKLKACVRPDALMLPGHDQKGGRVASWAHQLANNPALQASREQFVRDWGGWVGPSPKLLKESLYENFK